MQKPHKIDDIQRASIYRSETYLRKKAQAAAPSCAYEITSTGFFVLLVVAAFMIGLAL